MVVFYTEKKEIMKTMIKYMIILAAVAFAGAGCIKKNLDIHSPIENDGVKPAPVTNVQVTNGAGSATITYTIPKDADLQYVLAEYTVNSTTSRQAKTSRYSDTVFVDGFNEAGEYDVTLYAVDKGENRSEPVVIKVNPTTPAYRLVAATLTLNQDFGGVNVTFTNAEEAKIAVVIITRDNNGEFSPAEIFYTSTKDGYFSSRGYDTTAREFGVFIKDRWNNYSDTIIKTIHPLYETMLDKTKFRQYKLPTDQPSAWGWEMSAMWDGKIDQDYGFHTIQGGEPKPHRFTFDMGTTAKLSRFKVLQRYLANGSFFYNHGDPKLWNMYGTADIPNPDGSWNGWTLLMQCESKKPSGLPLGSFTDEDMAYARGSDGLGEEFTFPLSAPPVRYIRMEILKNWSNTDFFHAYEITFWGNPQ